VKGLHPDPLPITATLRPLSHSACRRTLSEGGIGWSILRGGITRITLSTYASHTEVQKTLSLPIPTSGYSCASSESCCLYTGRHLTGLYLQGSPTQGCRQKAKLFHPQMGTSHEKGGQCLCKKDGCKRGWIRESEPALPSGGVTLSHGRAAIPAKPLIHYYSNFGCC